MDFLGHKAGWERVKTENRGTNGEYATQHNTLLFFLFLFYYTKGRIIFFRTKRKVPVPTEKLGKGSMGKKDTGFCCLKRKDTHIFDKRYIQYMFCPNILKTLR